MKYSSKMQSCFFLKEKNYSQIALMGSEGCFGSFALQSLGPFLKIPNYRM